MGGATIVSADKYINSSEDVRAQASEQVGQTCLEALGDTQPAPDLQHTAQRQYSHPYLEFTYRIIPPRDALKGISIIQIWMLCKPSSLFRLPGRSPCLCHPAD